MLKMAKKPNLYDIALLVSLKMKGKAPCVTGVSPNEGTPGTLITIRGENLGGDYKDLIGLYICGTDCLPYARWESPKKIIARCGQARGSHVGDVIVVTKSGGKGECLVKFRIFTVQVGPLQESHVWVDETRTVPVRGLGGPAAINTHSDDDPLGISDEKQNRQLTDHILPEFFPDGSGDIRMKTFVPAWFLLANHQSASYEELKNGVEHMKRQHKDWQSGPKDFALLNLTSYIGCVDALDDIEKLLKEDKQSKDWPLTHRLEKQIIGCRNSADSLFAETLRGKERADATRNALAILQRFKFLFYLPRSIERNTDKGEYGLVLSDYTRAKTMFADTDIPLFREVYREVENQMKIFVQTLSRKLLEMPPHLEEQKNIIRYLLMIDQKKDPGWDCLCAYQRYITGLLWDSQTKYFDMAKHSKHLNESESESEDSGAQEFPVRYSFPEAVCGVLTSKLQDFWKLANAYLTGGLSSSVSHHSEKELLDILASVFNLARSLILNAVLPEALPSEVKQKFQDRLVSWPIGGADEPLHLMHVARTVRNCTAMLSQQEFTAKQIEVLHEMNIAVRYKCFNTIMERTIENVYALQHKETWKITTAGSDYSRTQLPDIFESIVSEVLPFFRQLIASNAPAEQDLFHVEKIGKSVLQSLLRLVCSFKETLERLSKVSDVAAGGSRPNRLSISGPDQRLSTGSGKEAGIKDKKLLIVMSNCDFCHKYGVSQIVGRMAQNGVAKTDLLLQQAQSQYYSLNTALKNAYIVAKSAPFAELMNFVDYSKLNCAVAVSSYIKDLVLCIVSVQAELYLSSKHFIPIIMNEIVYRCTKQLTEKIQQQTKSGVGGEIGRIQAVIDLTAFEQSLQAYVDGDIKTTLNSVVIPLMQKLPKTKQDDVFSAVEDFKQRAKILLLGLSQPSI